MLMLAPLLASMLPSVIPAVASAFGQERANNQTRDLARESMRFEAGQATQAMNFSERMSNTAWQRGMQDMRLAGINPMLAFSQGGASSPQGAMGSGSSATMNDVIGPAVSSAQHARRLAADMSAIKAGVARTKAEEASVLQGIRESESRVTNQKLESQERLMGLSSARARQTRSQIFQGPLDLGLELSRRLFDPQNARILSYELGQAGQRVRSGAGAAVGRAGSFLRGAADRLREIGPNRTQRN